MRKGYIKEHGDGTYNLYDYTNTGHLFHATKEELHMLVFDVIELLERDPVCRIVEGPSDHELCD